MTMFRGVYVPASIGIIGPTIFLRTGYVIQEAGYWRTILMIAVVMIIGLMTVSGVSGECGSSS